MTEKMDGKKIASQILSEYKEKFASLSRPLRLGVVVVGEDPVIAKFVEQKKRVAAEVGADFRIFKFPDTISTNELRKKMSDLVHEKANAGIIIQLPLPPSIYTQYILNSVTPDKDIDVLSAHSLGNFITGRIPIMPPVAGAVKMLFDEYRVDYKRKKIVILGSGVLVGKPIALWLLSENVGLTILNSSSPDVESALKGADIIISGIGKPNFIKSSMIKEGAILIDAGTSEAEGKIFGDVDYEDVSSKSSLVSPVPGGIGPITVALIYKNLFDLFTA